MTQLVLNSSQEIAVATIRSIIEHAPAFSMGHNIYSFDKTILAFALPKDYPYIKFFRGMSKSYIRNTAPSMGLMMNIPGINSLDSTIRTSIDVLLYNTGAMATSCVCFHALESKYVYNWTRCDWKPQDFKGGERLITSLSLPTT